MDKRSKAKTLWSLEKSLYTVTTKHYQCDRSNTFANRIKTWKTPPAPSVFRRLCGLFLAADEPWRLMLLNTTLLCN